MADRDGSNWRRRDLLGAVGAGGVTTLAGCSGGGSQTTTDGGGTRVTVLHDTHVHGRYGEGGAGANVETYFGLMESVAADSDSAGALRVGAGDDLAPSVLARAFDGRHVTEAFDAGGLDVDTFGNHDFDLGPSVTRERVADSEFTWVSANVLDPETGAVFAKSQGAKRYELFEVGDATVGVTGLLHADAPEVTKMGDAATVRDPEPALRDVVESMRGAGADAVVVCSHLASPDAVALLEGVDGVDLLVGDHAARARSSLREVGGTYCSFVGDGYEYLGEVTLTVDGGVTDAELRRHDTARAFQEGVDAHPDVRSVARSYRSKLDDRLGAVLGRTTVPLEARENVLRTRESNLGNYVADAVRERLGADLALVNGGALRGDRRYGPGAITRRTVKQMLPFRNRILAVAVDGKTLRAALENGVSRVAQLGGRFPQVSGLSYAYDPSRERGDRILDLSVGGEPVADGRRYSVGTLEFLGEGGDGYQMLRDASRVVPPSEGPVLATLVMERVRDDGTIAPPPEGRIKRR